MAHYKVVPRVFFDTGSKWQGSYVKPLNRFFDSLFPIGLNIFLNAYPSNNELVGYDISQAYAMSDIYSFPI